MNPTRDRQKITAASEATDVVLEAYDNAARCLRGAVHCNRYGVLADVSMVSNRLLEAKAEIDKALKAINACRWPTNADYGED